MPNASQLNQLTGIFVSDRVTAAAAASMYVDKAASQAAVGHVLSASALQAIDIKSLILKVLVS